LAYHLDSERPTVIGTLISEIYLLGQTRIRFEGGVVNKQECAIFIALC
jgi:hypothetical protein